MMFTILILDNISVVIHDDNIFIHLDDIREFKWLNVK